MSDLGERLRELIDWNPYPFTHMNYIVRAVAEDALARIDTLTEQVADYKRRLSPLGGDCALTNCGKCYACLRSENARLAEQVRGAKGRLQLIAELADYPFTMEAGTWDGPRFAKLLRDISARASIYNEGAGGRSGSASPQSGDGVSGVDAAPTSRTEEVQ